MAMKKGGLGKGLDSLISDKASTKIAPKTEKTGDGAILVKISKVEPNREQPRKAFDEESLQELAASVKQFGVLQPLLVQERDGYYEIIAGERRWRAAKLAGLKEIPVIIKKLSDQEIMEISLIENIQREDLNPIEEAQAFRRLIEEFHMKQEDLANRVSKSRAAVTNSMRLLKLSEDIQNMVIDGSLSTGHARTLITLADPKLQMDTAKQILDKKLSVRETEKLVKKIQEQKQKAEKEENSPEKNDSAALQAIYRDLEEQMKKIYGTKVSINSKSRNSGKIEIEYYSQDDLERIIDLLKNNG